MMTVNSLVLDKSAAKFEPVYICDLFKHLQYTFTICF